VGRLPLLVFQQTLKNATGKIRACKGRQEMHRNHSGSVHVRFFSFSFMEWFKKKEKKTR
jgi:hypothetical protein